MSFLRQSPSYAESQIRLLLSELKNSNHTIRTKAVVRFQEYITTYSPEIYDDDIDFLFCGAANEDGPAMGLFYFSGLDSG